MDASAAKPDWDRLFEVAAAQEGYFTTQQAAEAGYSSQLLLKHIRAGRVARVRRGIYRLVQKTASSVWPSFTDFAALTSRIPHPSPALYKISTWANNPSASNAAS
jgi:predicted transcriptional regulator of viral defense system